MSTLSELTLPEQFLLLALDDKKGTINNGTVKLTQYGLVGAAIVELSFSEKVKIQNGKLALVDNSYTDNIFLNKVIDGLKNSKKSMKTQQWIALLGNEDAINSTADSLVNKGILTAKKQKYLGLFNITVYPMRNSAEKLGLISKIRGVILYNNKTEPKSAALIELVNKCGLTKKLFSKEERIKAKSRIKQIKIVKEDLTSKTVADNVTALQGTIDSTLKNLQYTQKIGYLVTVLGLLTTLFRYFST
jgi:golgi phosphoprotein 3